jgi:hypothetical protein
MKKVWSLAFVCLALLSGAHAQESFGLANSATGTTLNTLTKVVVNGGVPQAEIVATTDTSGAVGITTLGNGTTGTAIVTRSGIAPCVFDNTVVAGHFVQIAPGTAGDCHDAGATRPTSGQIIGIGHPDRRLGGNLQRTARQEHPAIVLGAALPASRVERYIEPDSRQWDRDVRDDLLCSFNCHQRRWPVH